MEIDLRPVFACSTGPRLLRISSPFRSESALLQPARLVHLDPGHSAVSYRFGDGDTPAEGLSIALDCDSFRDDRSDRLPAHGLALQRIVWNSFAHLQLARCDDRPGHALLDVVQEDAACGLVAPGDLRNLYGSIRSPIPPGFVA